MGSAWRRPWRARRRSSGRTARRLVFNTTRPRACRSTSRRRWRRCSGSSICSSRSTSCPTRWKHRRRTPRAVFRTGAPRCTSTGAGRCRASAISSSLTGTWRRCPQGKQAATLLESDGYCLSALTANKHAGWAFIEFAASVPGQTILAETGRSVPSLASVASSPAFLVPGSKPQNSQVFLESIGEPAQYARRRHLDRRRDGGR